HHRCTGMSVVIHARDNTGNRIRTIVIDIVLVDVGSGRDIEWLTTLHSDDGSDGPAVCKSTHQPVLDAIVRLIYKRDGGNVTLIEIRALPIEPVIAVVLGLGGSTVSSVSG